MHESWPHVCCLKITFTVLSTNRFVSTSTNSMKCLANWIPLRICVPSRSTKIQPQHPNIILSDAGRTTKFAPVKSLRFSELFLGILLSEFRFTVFLPLGSGFMNPPPSVFSNRERKSPQRGLGRSLERMRHQCNFSAPP